MVKKTNYNSSFVKTWFFPSEFDEPEQTEQPTETEQPVEYRIGLLVVFFLVMLGLIAGACWFMLWLLGI